MNSTGEVGRVDLPETRRNRHLDRQPPLRDGQRGLHVERGGIDVAVEVELDGDRRWCPATSVDDIEEMPAMVES